MRNTPLPATLSGEIVERLIRADKSLLYLISGALEFAVDREPYDETGALTVEEVREALGEMLWIYYTEEVPPVALIGEMKFLAFDSVPDKYLACDGSAVSRATYADLFAAIGTTWGAGNGTTTFNLPDLRGRSPMGSGTPSSGGTDAMTIGQKTGEQKHQLSIAEMPAHSHIMVDRALNLLKVYTGTTGANLTGQAGSGSNGTANLGTSGVGSNTPHNTIHPVGVGLFVIYTGVE